MTLELVECVNRGALMLDVVWPDWYTQIDLEKFDLWSEHWGLLEQICGSQDAAIKVLAPRDSAFASKLARDRDAIAAYYGFIVRGGRTLWDSATALWREQIKTRLRASAPAVATDARAGAAS